MEGSVVNPEEVVAARDDRIEMVDVTVRLTLIVTVTVVDMLDVDVGADRVDCVVVLVLDESVVEELTVEDTPLALAVDTNGVVVKAVRLLQSVQACV